MRNRSYQPTSGHRYFFAQELPLVSDNYELSNSLEYTKYKKLSKSSDIVGKVSFFGKAVNALSDANDVRISKRLFLPSSKLRGFEPGRVGPFENNDHVGGNYMTSFNASTSLPTLFPTFENIDFSVFFDAGNVWGVDYDNSIKDSSKIRTSTGLSMDILTPIGPLSFVFGQALTKSSSDVTESFRFNLGTTF
jgi:outer membrane protein insertion porin family